MSDIQDPPVVLQHRMQQRQILAMMGITQWVQPSSETINITDISAATESQSSLFHQSASNESTEQPSIDVSSIDHSNYESLNNESVDSILDVADKPARDFDVVHNGNEAQDINLHANEKSPVSYSFDTTTSHSAIILSTSYSHDSLQQTPQNVEQAVTSLIETVTTTPTASVKKNHIADINNDDSFKKVAPFDLQGGRYGDWVVLVDIQALNNESQKLWKNITQALSITCETTSFPICEGMDTAELANASLAGYVFKIGRSEEIQVASLTALPDGLEHPTLTTVPTLDEMLTDSSLKRQFWEQLSSQS